MPRTSVKRKVPDHDGGDGAECCKPPQETACYLCKESWTSQGAHRICCVPCGHVHGRSCLENWLHSEAQCPQCEESFEPNDIINLYVTKHLWNGCGHEKFIADAHQMMEENYERLCHMEGQQGLLDELIANFTECGRALDSLVDQIENILVLGNTAHTVATTLEKMEILERRIALLPIAATPAGHGVVERKETSADPGRNSELTTCCICMDPWTSYGAHHICCIPCGHVYGRSCLEKWLRCSKESTAECPLCRKSFEQEDIIYLSATNYEWNDYRGHHKEIAQIGHRLDEFNKRVRRAESLVAVSDKRAAHIAEYVSLTSSLSEEIKKMVNANADRSNEEMLNIAMELLRKWPKMYATV